MKSQVEALENGTPEMVDSATNGSEEGKQNATGVALAPSSSAPNPHRNPPKRKTDRRLSHGLFSFMVNGSLPKGFFQTEQNIHAFRRTLETVVVQRHGPLSLYHTALCQSASRHEARAQLLNRWLCKEEILTIEQKLSVSREIGSATDCRDRCLKALGLDAQAANFWQEQSTPAA